MTTPDLNYPRHIVAVAGLISNDNGEILLVRSPRRGWEFPGGQVEEGEWISGELQTSSETVETEWVPRSKVLERVTHPAIYGRMEHLLAFSGHILYRAYTNNPYQVFEERLIS